MANHPTQLTASFGDKFFKLFSIINIHSKTHLVQTLAIKSRSRKPNAFHCHWSHQHFHHTILKPFCLVLTQVLHQFTRTTLNCKRIADLANLSLGFFFWATKQRQKQSPTCLVDKVQLRLKSSMKEKEPFSSSDAAWRSSSSSTSIPTSIFIFSNAWFILSISLLFLTLFLEKIWRTENWIRVRIRVRKLSLLQFAANFPKQRKWWLIHWVMLGRLQFPSPLSISLYVAVPRHCHVHKTKKICSHLLLRANRNHV